MTPVEKYFGGERVACLIGAGIGIAALASAAYFLWYVRKPFYTGMAYPFIVLGFFFLVICVGVVIRSPKDISRVTTMITDDHSMVQTEEMPRMQKVMRNFKVIIIVELSLIVLSVLALFLVQHTAWRGAFAATLLMCTFLLVFDWLADRRGREYVEYLEKIV